MSGFAESMRALTDLREDRRRAAEAAYGALRAQGKLGSHRVLAYRCSRRCLLLDVLMFPEPLGVIVHQPRYKLSPTVNEASSSESGRAKNTEDGARRWRARYYSPDEMLNAALNCDHLQHVVIDRDRIVKDMSGQDRVIIISSADDAGPAGPAIRAQDDTPNL